MKIENLDYEDYCFLIKALKAWEEQGDLRNFVNDMKQSAMAQNSDEAMALAKSIQGKQAKRNTRRRLREERSILMKAKLLRLRDKEVAKDVSEEVENLFLTQARTASEDEKNTNTNEV